jgi:hypothetical protein
MDQLFCVTLHQELNNFKYSLSLPIGASWADAIEATKQFGAAIVAMAQQAEDQAQKSKISQEADAAPESQDTAPAPSEA